MTYLDNAATTLQKPPQVRQAMERAVGALANPGRGGHRASMLAAQAVYACRSLAAELFDVPAENVCFTLNATHALNLAIFTLVKPGARVVISGYEHNAVIRPLFARGANTEIAASPLFAQDECVRAFARAMTSDTAAVIVNHVSNVFGNILPVGEIAALCRKRNIPLIVDASQSAGTLPLSVKELGAAFVAMPGHKGLYGPQGTGLLLCKDMPQPLLFGGTGSNSEQQQMPDFLPDRVEAGTLNVPGISGLAEGLRFVLSRTSQRILQDERALCTLLAQGLQQLGGYRVFDDREGGSVLSFQPQEGDCEELAAALSERGIALRAGLHCAPLAHRTVGTFERGTVRASFSAFSTSRDVQTLLEALAQLTRRNNP